MLWKNTDQIKTIPFILTYYKNIRHANMKQCNYNYYYLSAK